MTAKAGKKAVRLYKKYVKQTETINRKRKKSKKDVETLERIYRRLPKKANPERSRGYSLSGLLQNLHMKEFQEQLVEFKNQISALKIDEVGFN